MKKSNASLISAIGAALMLAPAAALAGSAEGKFQLKGYITGVLPDGKITRVVTDAVPLPGGSQTEASDSVVPTIAAEYFFRPNFSVETICCVTPHDVKGDGALAGADLVDDAIILPSTVTAKFHFQTSSAFKPYVGAGVSYFFIFDEGVGADAADLGVTRVDLSDEFGFVLQAGFDWQINERGLGVGLDVKRYFVDTTASFFAGQTLALRSDHQLDPWVISGGLTYRF